MIGILVVGSRLAQIGASKNHGFPVDFPWASVPDSLTEDLTFFSVLLRSGLHVLRRWRGTELRL